VATATWQIPADRDEVAPLRHRVIAHAAEHDIPEPPINDIALALSEAVTNAVVHAYEGREPGHITVRLDIDRGAGRIRVIVADDGHGMIPRPDTPGLGLGLPLIAQLAQAFEIRTPPNGQGTEICMAFQLG
jgi:serine/threonine-protein kinase RsbW/stage II sporulation protein AB (anti-sigma F factor)